MGPGIKSTLRISWASFNEKTSYCIERLYVVFAFGVIIMFVFNDFVQVSDDGAVAKSQEFVSLINCFWVFVLRHFCAGLFVQQLQTIVCVSQQLNIFSLQ
ncbi:hypothetical protein ASF08_16465 [Methylobacterium sp. Leaf85]|nr:hypothetical protein ASF08_16465 [Methylobacterium sp. Leaf85]